MTHRLALAALFCSTLTLAADGGTSPDAGAHPVAAPARDAGPATTDLIGAIFDAGRDYVPDNATAKETAMRNTSALKTGGGSHCKMVRVSDQKVLVDRHSAGSIMDCQEEVRTEIRTKFCKKSRERLELSFSGEWNGIAMAPIPIHLWCPRTDMK